MNDQYERVAAFAHDNSGPPPPARLTDEALATIRGKAALSLQLQPLSPGNNDGLVYYADGQLAFDTHGHERFAEVMSNAQPWLLQLLTEVLYLRGALNDIARDVHAPDCHRTSGDRQVDVYFCDCHRDYAREVLASP